MMLREIANVRQIPDEQERRWFTSETMDLIVWIGEKNDPVGFQLCYDKSGAEHAITWMPESGFSHMSVDNGEAAGGMKYKTTPILVSGQPLDSEKIIRLFGIAARNLPDEIKDFVVAKIEQSVA